MAKLKMKPLEWVAYILVAVGALNWGLVEVLGFDLVGTLLSWIGLTKFAIWIYGVVGLAGAWAIYKIWK